MRKLILILLVAGGVIWDVCQAHRPVPPRNPLRLQRMAPRAPLHPRPPRHHQHQHQHHPHQHHQHQHPQQQAQQSNQNMIHVPQHGSKPHHRSFKPRIHIPFLHHRPLLARLHPHYHHSHHPPHHHHHHGPHHHPGHQHNHHHQHAHHPHQQHHPGRPGQQQQQLVAGAQLPRLPQNGGYPNQPGMKPQQQQHNRHQNQHQQQQQHFGFPALDATPAHTNPQAAPVGPPQRNPLRHFPSNPHFNFQQDPELPFGNEPVSELPTSTAPYHGGLGGSTQSGIQQTTSAYGETSANPHQGFLGSTYKGWKPIAKPYQNAYPRLPEHHQQQQAGLPDFPRGPHGFPGGGQGGFPRGPQDFPQLSDNHLQSFPIHDFPSGPTGPPSHQDFPPRGPQGNHFDAFPHIPDPPQMQGFVRAPPAGGNHPGGDGSQLLDFPQFNEGHDGQAHHFPQGPPPPPPRGPAHHHRHHPSQQAGKINQQQYQQHTAPPPQNHFDFGAPPPSGHSSTTTRHEFPQFFPSGAPPSDNSFNNLNTNTLFRENTGNINNQHHHQHHPQQHGNSHSINGQSVEVALPPEIGDTVRLPNSIFADNTWTQNNGNHQFETSQSEENVVIKKPKFGGRHKLNHQGQGPASSPSSGSSDETVESQGPPSILPKFRPRPRPNNNKNNNNDGEKSLGNQESDNDGPQKLSTGSDEGYDGGSGQNLKQKLNNNGRGRVRIRTRLRRPNPFSNIGGDENDSSSSPGPGPGSSSRPFPPFPGAKSESSSSSRLRHPFRKPPQHHSPPQDNSISTETPNSSGGDDHSGGSLHHHQQGPHGPQEGPGIKGPISEELSNFPTLPFPPPDPDFIRDFPSPVQQVPVSPPPQPPSPPSSPKERDQQHQQQHHRLPPPFGRPSSSVGIRGSPDSGSTEDSLGPSPPPSPPPPPTRDNSHPSPRPHLRRRRPKQPNKQEQNDHHHQQHHHDEPEHTQQDHQQRQRQQQENNHGGNGNELNSNAPSLGLSQSLFSDEFFFPPGFNADPSKHTPGDNPVSFITMPNAKPHIIHHNVLQPQLQSSSTEQNNHRPQQQATPPQQQNLYHGPTTQHFPPLEDFNQQNVGVNNLPFSNNLRHHPQHHVPAPAPPRQNHHHHHRGHHPNQQLSAFSDHPSFQGRHPVRGRKPGRGNNNHPSKKAPPPPPPPPTPQQVINPYAYPASNPYAVAGQYIPPTGHQLLDSAPQTSNSYEIPEGQIVFNSNRQPQNGPVYHHTIQTHPAPPPTQQQQHINHHRHHHNGHHGAPAPPPPPKHHNIGLPAPPSPLPPLRHGGPPPARGRFPGGRGGQQHHRKPIVPALIDPVGSQSAEFEQIPAQYVDVSGLGTTPAVIPTVPVVTTQARPVFSKPHVHHSPDIHPPGSFFDDFFKPFDDAFGQSPQGVGAASTQRSDGGDPMMHDEHQSQSNVQVNVLPSPKSFNNQTGGEAGAGDKKGIRKHWNKLKVPAKDEKPTPSSMEKPGRLGKKPINGRFNNPNNKNHLKAKIADITRKNFQSHLATASVDGNDSSGAVGPETVTTYKPAFIDPAVSNGSSSGGEGAHQIPAAISSESTTTPLKVIPTWKDSEDDLADSNVPKSVVRFGSKTEGGPMLIHHRNRNSNNNNNEQDHQDGTTILFKSKRQFRRKRPGQQEKELDHHDEPTGRPSPLRQPKQELDNNHSLDNEDTENGTGSETTRVGVIRRRKLFPRRRNFSLSSKTSAAGAKGGVDSSTTPEATDAESVTYGEGQWFRVKKFDSQEDEKVHPVHKETLAVPVPTPESKTAAELPGSSSSSSPNDDGLSSSSHNNNDSNNNNNNIKSRKNNLLQHAESTMSSVSSSVSSSSSSSSTSVATDDRQYGKKSSRFLMNRLTIT